MAYDPKLVEDRRYKEWMEAGYFTPSPEEGTPYCITIPPPNITGSLHLGHALNNSIIDALIRWHRMRGDNTLCLPGTDHAGIGTQNVVERELAKEGLTRHDLGREKFIERCWEWRRQYGDRIVLQFQRMGLSYDWSRLRFTMDESYVDAIYEEFMRWWDRGLIYRGARVINWCPRCRSAISDLEVDSEERAGKLWHFRYPFADGEEEGPRTRTRTRTIPDYIVIATTRPETLLGDTAVAVNPADSRYEGMVGRMIRLPLTDRVIPLIADEYAKMEFGTGAVKVTPAHDLDDFEAGLRNNLPQIVVIGEDGAMTSAAGARYAGLDRFEARDLVVGDMEAAGLLEKIEDYTVKTPICDRCKTVLEPLLSEQWFVKMQPLAEPAIQVVKEGRIKFFPERYTRIYLDWMENIRDWCISRQLWWGHRIPVYWTSDGRYTAARSLEEAASKLGVTASDLKQDEDVLDTWFSSALWPHATLGWPRDTSDLKFWYPTNLLSTAQEILYLWVARMIMTGLDFLGEIPFHHVYIHATVLDAKGERMSKSKGNGIDPLDLIDKYGADALRFYLLSHAGKNQDIKIREDDVRLAGTFCNKLWNAGQFVMANLGEVRDQRDVRDISDELALADKWILSQLARTVDVVNRAMESYDMDDACGAMYQFFWGEFCDWYIELAKPRLRSEDSDSDIARSTCLFVLETILALLHPFMPFITEEVWQQLPEQGRLESQTLRSGLSCAALRAEASRDSGSIMFAPYPRSEEFGSLINSGAEESMELVLDSIRGFRNLKAEAAIPQGQRTRAAIVPGKPLAAQTLSTQSNSIAELARLARLEMWDEPHTGEGKWVSSPIAAGELFLEIGDALDIPKELERLTKEIAVVSADLAKSEAKLANAQFTERAPTEIVERERQNHAALLEKKEKLEARRSLLG